MAYNFISFTLDLVTLKIYEHSNKGEHYKMDKNELTSTYISASASLT